MWLLLLMLFIMPFEASPYLYLADNFLGIFPDFTVIKLLGLLGFGWAALRIGSGDVGGEGILASRQAKLFLLFYAGVLLSGTLNGTGFLVISKYLAFLLFMPFVLVTVRTHDDLRRVVYALALSYIVVFPYAVRQMLRFGGRLGVGVSETNYFGANLLLVIPLAFVIAYQQPTRGRRLLWLAGGGALVAALYLTSSRGGFLGLLVAGVHFVYRRRGLGAAVAVLALLVASVFVLPTDLGERALATITDTGPAPAGLEASNQAHTALFFAGFRMIADSPLFGVGPLNFKALSTLYTGLDISFMAHNTYLELAAELGLLVLGVFLLLVVFTFGALGRAARLDGSPEARELAGWAMGMRSGLIGFLVAATFISAEYEKMFWMFVFVSVVVGRLATRHEREAMSEAEERAPLPFGALPEPSR
jgi:O-antigen ligase/polysaccharide polymerase Wzy-like membrane protein